MIKSSARSFDFVRNVLTCSASYLKKASQIGTEEYREVLQYRHDNPGMTIEVMEKKPSANRPASITFVQMEKFISLCRDSEDRLNQFQKIKSLSKIQSSPYSYVKTWFLNNYANYSEQPEFDPDGFVVVKTKSQMEAEKAAVEAQEQNTEEVLVETEAQSEMVAA